MRKRILLIALMVMTLLAAGSCSPRKQDAAVADDRPVLTIGDTVYTRSQIEPMLEIELDIMEVNYSRYGMTMDRNDPDVLQAAQEYIFSGLIYKEVIEQKAAEFGITLTDEELAEIQSTGEANYQANVSVFRQMMFGGLEIGEEIIQRELAMYGYPSTLEESIDAVRKSKLEDKLIEVTTADVTVSDEEIQALYDSELAQKKTDYDTYPALFETALNTNKTIYYVPEGFRYVKTIFVPFTEADAAAIADVNRQIAYAGEGADTSALTDQLDTLRITAVGNIQPTLDEIRQKLDEGEDFDSLIALYSKDEGSMAEPIKSNGYPMYEACITTLGADFRNAAMALSTPGEISQPVITDTGVHYILYVSDITPGPIPLEDIRDRVEADALKTKKEEAFQVLIIQWMQEADVVIDLDALN